ncbi:MAG: hypothetical protein V3V29_04010 [Acidimicrobiia bacterium]
MIEGHQARRSVARVLAGVHTAAQGRPYPFWPLPTQQRLQGAVTELGYQLADALFLRSWVRIDCGTLRQHPVAVPKVVAALCGGRLLVTHTDRTSRLPYTGRRLDRYLVTDLRFLAWEARQGVTRRCPQCGGLHRLRTGWLEELGTHQVFSDPVAEAPLPKVYPDVEDTAFAEILGPLPRGLAALDDLLVGMPPSREAHYRETYADHPAVLTYQEFISSRKDLLIQDDPRQPAGYRQAWIASPAQPAELPATVRVREQKPGAEPPSQ